MIYTDLHTHPILKSFGKNNFNPSSDFNNKANLFHHKKINLWNRFLENIVTITPYRQADLLSAELGETRLIGLSMYAPERDFFIGEFDASSIENWVTDFGQPWINKIKDKNTSYFENLKSQFNFIEALDQTETFIDGKPYKYQIITNGQDVYELRQNTKPNTIYLFYNIEGGHNLFNQVETQQKSSEKIVVDSISFIKSKKPFYFTLAHHFYNQLSGHCISLPKKLQKLRHQKYGSNSNKPEESKLRMQGELVIRELLSQNNGQRVLIDIKHMNPIARNQYYEILDEYKAKGDNIPLLFSHGGANGMDSFESKNINNKKLHNQEIGLYDNEIVRLVKSGGLFGLNLDERVMSSPKALKETKNICFSKRRRFKETSRLIWNNIEQILKVCKTEKINPWESIAIGSDFDGIINPINGFWTLKYLPRLYYYLNKYHLKPYLNDNPEDAFGMSPNNILNKVFSENTIQFMIKHYGTKQAIS